jgi:hypothetical protein
VILLDAAAQTRDRGPGLQAECHDCRAIGAARDSASAVESCRNDALNVDDMYSPGRAASPHLLHVFLGDVIESLRCGRFHIGRLSHTGDPIHPFNQLPYCFSYRFLA